MSYGQCLKCPAAVAAWSLSAAAVAAVSEASLLCVEHLGVLMQLREQAIVAAEREKLRRWCECGRELFFRAVQRAAVGDPCHWCKAGQPVSVAVIDGGKLNPRRMGENYIYDTCQGDGVAPCELKKVFRLPDGRVACEKHGATPVEERITS